MWKKRYQRGNQKPEIEEGQTTQNCQKKKDRQHKTAKRRRTDNTKLPKENRQKVNNDIPNKQNIKQHEPHWKSGVNTGATEGYSVPGYLIKYCWKLR
jgi:ribosomal protein S25